MRKIMAFKMALILIIMALAFTVPMNASAPDPNPGTLNHYADPTGSNTYPYETPAKAAHSIQDAINSAWDGDTVHVEDGTYSENIVITAQINLIGKNTATTIIDGGSKGDVVIITADSVYFKGFTVKNSGLNWGDAGIQIDSSDICTIIECNSNNNYHGILLDPSSNSNSIVNNEVTQNTKGIWLDQSSNYNTISNNIASNNIEGIVVDISNYNLVSDNLVFNNSQDGINLHEFSAYNIASGNDVSYNKIGIDLFWSACNNVITNNHVFNNHYGIYVSNLSHNNTLSYNTVSDNIANGITLEYSDWITVDNNSITNNDIGLKLTSSYNNNIINNWFSGNNIGIFVDPSDDNIIQGNTIIVNQVGLAIDEWSTGNIIYHNDFVENDKMVCCHPECGCGAPKNSFHSPDMLEGNYWSDYTGMDDGSGKGLYGEPRVEGDGIGDTNIPHLGYDWYPLMSSRSLTGPIDRSIQDLSEDAFGNRPDQRKNALYNKLVEVQELINAGEYQEALDKLIHDIRSKTDGSVGGNPKNDWITDPTMQMELCAMIDKLIGHLEALI